MASASHSARKTALSLTSAFLAVLIGAGSVLASTPVTVGYRDHSYGGGAARPAGDKPQSKLWYTDGSWFAGMFLFRTTPTPLSVNRIYRLDTATHSWTDTATNIDDRDTSHADYLWDEASQTLYVVSVPVIPDALPAAPANEARVYKYSYNATTNAYALIGGFPATIPGTVSDAVSFFGGAPTATIALDSTGDLWATWPRNNEVKYSKSDDGGATWSAAAQLPAQIGNSIQNGLDNEAHDSAAVIAFGANVGFMWSDQDNSPASTDNGFWFATIAAGADPAMGGTWSAPTKLPTLADPGEVADNHINMKTTSDGSVYMVGKTGKDTILCATNKEQPLVEFFERTPGGTWSTSLVGTVGDCNTRPQVVISEQLNTAYVFLTSPNGGGTIYRKSAPLSGSAPYVFRGAADQTIQRGTPFIQSATETLIDDPSTTKQVVTSASGIVVIANNLTAAGSPNAKFYLHNEMALPASDATPPAGTVAINAGAVGTTLTAVSVDVPATDAGSGVSLVRLSNLATVNGSGVLSGTGSTSFNYDTPIAWTLTAGQGTKTVYVQWRDSAGNWSAVSNDTIVFDTTAPSGTVQINAGAAETELTAATLNLTADDGTGSGVVSVLISNTTDFSTATPTAFAASIPWTLPAGVGTKTVYVKFVDGAGNTSAPPASDDIAFVANAPTGTVAINGGAATTEVAGVTLDLTAADGTGSGVVSVLISNTTDFTGVVPTAYAASIPWVLPAGNGPKTVYVLFRDAAGNTSSPVTDSIELASPDVTNPTNPGVNVHRIGGTVTSGIPVRLSWTAGTDPAGPSSGVAGYTVQRRIGTGAWVTVGSPTTTSFSMQVASGHQYRFRVATRDMAGNLSQFVNGSLFTPRNFHERSASIRYRGTWRTPSSVAYLGGRAKYATGRNASATFTFTGNRFGWLSYRSPKSGKARVYVNNRLIATVNLYSATNQTKALVFQTSWSSVRTRTVRIVVVGTAGHPRVTLDSFFTMR